MLTAFVASPVLATSAVKQLEEQALAGQINAEALIVAAGKVLAQVIIEEWPQAQQVAIFCGAGNNGADGYSAALALAALGVKPLLVVVAPPRSTSAQVLYAACQKQAFTECSAEEALARAELVVDALLANGTEGRALAGAYLRAVNAMCASGLPLLAVDLPTGVHGDTAVVGAVAVAATRTVAFIAPRLAHTTGAAAGFCGATTVHPLGVPVGQGVPVACWVQQQCASFLPKRAFDAHKGTQGHLLIIGGGYGMGGAALLAAEAALRAGAGKITVLTMAEHVPAFLARQPELMVRGVAEGECIKEWLAQADAVMIGSGLGLTSWGKSLWQQAINTPKPLLCDADALTWWGRLKSAPRAGATVFTPHPGEAAVLLGCTPREVQQSRLHSLRQLTVLLGGTVVLKGNGTLVSRQQQPPLVLGCGNPGMAVGGMGDVLSGIIGALLCQGLSPDEAAFYGAWWHGRSADYIAAKRGEIGLLPTDLIAALPESYQPWLKE